LILPALYILSSLILVCGAALIYTGNRHSPKHRAFALLFIFMACWQQSALLVVLTTPEQAKYVFMYGLIPLLLVSFMLLLHAVYLITKVYVRRKAVLYKLLFIPPVVNVLLFPVEGWLYQEELIMYSEEQP